MEVVDVVVCMLGLGSPSNRSVCAKRVLMFGGKKQGFEYVSSSPPRL